MYHVSLFEIILSMILHKAFLREIGLYEEGSVFGILVLAMGKNVIELIRLDVGRNELIPVG